MAFKNFLDVDPHFPERAREFRDFVRAAHEQGMYIILDIVAHHTGNVFTYDADRYTTHDPATGQWYEDPRWDGKPYAVKGFNDRDRSASVPFDALRSRANGGRVAGRRRWAPPVSATEPVSPQGAHHGKQDYYPEYAERDMFSLKTLDLRVQWDGQYREASSALACLGLVYCFWIAYADVDGFRIDAAKHIGTEALRTFCDITREFAQSIGKGSDFFWLGKSAAVATMPGKL